MKIPESSHSFTWFLRLATFALVVFGLREGQDVLVPIAFSVLLAFLLSPMVVKLNRLGLPRTAAIISTVAFAFLVLGALGWVVTRQAVDLARELPNYEENLRAKIVALKHPPTPLVVSRMSDMVENLRREMKTPSPAEADAAAPQTEVPEVRPVPVEVHSIESGPWELASDILLPIAKPLGIAFIVMVFLIAILFQREDLRDRFIRLVSAGKLNIATQAVDDAAARVSRYLFTQVVVNSIYAVPIGIGLFFVGVPNALLWGLLAGLLRFIPFVGPWLGALFPIALTIAVDPGWTMLLYTIAIFAVMETIVVYFVEPVLYGASTGVSNLAILVATIFWTWVWGPAGLVLATPLTVCLLVIGSYVPGLGFLRMMLGSEPALAPAAQFYQRMLSMESEDMIDLAKKHVAEHSLEDFYEQLFVPALQLSEEDRHAGTLPAARQEFIFQASRDLIEELERRDDKLHPMRSEAEGDGIPDMGMPTMPTILGLPARDEADEIVALALSHLLRRRGVRAAVLSRVAPLEDAFRAIERRHAKAIFISSLPPSAVTTARQLSHRVRARFPHIPLLVGIWQHPSGVKELAERLHGVKAEEVAVSLKDAAVVLESTSTSVASSAPFLSLTPVKAEKRPPSSGPAALPLPH